MLGPTNTGKTHYAVERMLAHSSGVIGLPLRLLAREVYDRIRQIKGEKNVALVTGEEKIWPETASYVVATTEAMPLDKDFAFVAVDEIQLCGDPERGHIFTDRLLNARGRDETVFMGADTIASFVRRLLPKAEVISRPRLSTLTYAGEKKISRLPKRTAIVCFSTAEVYALAELIRRQNGGAAVVLGALSPRTRNAQAALYQAGEVDYLVATDAIGMGLNMDINHVAFASLVKFDGRQRRALTPAEIGQIAGRAGRYNSNGTFGGTADLSAFDPELIEKIEQHRFDPLQQLSWRNNDLDFSSPQDLMASLDQLSGIAGLQRAREAVDYLTLKAMIERRDVIQFAKDLDGLQLLWQVCQIPDFRKTLADSHFELVAQVFLHLIHRGQLPEDWVDQQIKRLARYEGDIDSLTGRLSHIRTWTFISHRQLWLKDPKHWQAKTREIEDQLSDALHRALTHRFVDRRSSAIISRMRGGDQIFGWVDDSGLVRVEGQAIGELRGWQFVPQLGADAFEAHKLKSAASRALGPAIAARVALILSTADDQFVLSPQAEILWNQVPLAKLVAGTSNLKPKIKLMDPELLTGVQREQLQAKLQTWLDQRLQ